MQFSLGGSQPPSFEGRAHFFGAAARAMRNILVDHARRRSRQKRDAGQPAAPLSSEVSAPDLAPTVDLLALDEALAGLDREHERPAQIVMLRYFAGLEMKDIAQLLGVSDRTITREWLFARTWLRRALRDPD